MGIDLNKTSHVIFFVVFLPALSLGLGWLCAKLMPAVPFWVETLSPLAAYGLLYGFFDAHAWHWRVFRILGIVTAPDVRGRWLGSQLSSFKDTDGKNRTSRVIMEIKQTFSYVKAVSYYKHWQSEHTVASFINVDDECTLFIMFEAEPKVSHEGNGTPHKGVMRLTQQPNGQLEGSYFNANGHSGELHFKRTRYTLHHTFESAKSNK